MKKFVLVFSLSIMIWTCKRENAIRFANNTIQVKDSELNQKCKASDIIHSVKIVPLETTDESLIGSVDKIIVREKIFILDAKSMFISIFDLDGNFLTKIYRKGRGAQEYLFIDDFTITDDNKVVVLDGELQQVIHYDISGKFLSKQKLSFHADAIESLNDNLFVLNGSSTGLRVFVWNQENNKIIETYFEYNPKFSIRILQPLIKHNDKIYYTHAYSSFIYNVGEKGVTAEWYLDFAERNIKEKNLQRMELGFYVPLPNVVDIGRFIETDDYVVFSFECEELNEYPYYVYYNKNEKTKIILNYEYYTDDILFNKYPPQIIAKTDDGRFVQAITAYQLLKNRSEYDLHTFSQNERRSWDVFQERLDQVSDFSNPIVIFYSLK